MMIKMYHKIRHHSEWWQIWWPKQRHHVYFMKHISLNFRKTIKSIKNRINYENRLKRRP